MSRHAAILGRSQMGKSLLAWFLCDAFTKAGRKTLVYDLTLSDAEVKSCNRHEQGAPWNATFTVNNEEDFLYVFWTLHDLIVFIDEGGEAAGRANEEMMWTLTRGSHQWGELGSGNSIFLIGHGYRTLSKTGREQCSEYFVFAMGKSSAKDLADEFDAPELLSVPHLRVGEFYHAGSGMVPRKKKVNRETGQIETVA